MTTLALCAASATLLAASPADPASTRDEAAQAVPAPAVPMRADEAPVPGDDARTASGPEQAQPALHASAPGRDASGATLAAARQVGPAFDEANDAYQSQQQTWTGP